MRDARLILYFISSKAVMKFIHPTSSRFAPADANTLILIRQAACHPTTNRVHSTASREGIREVRRETNRDHLDRLVLELMSAHKRLVRNNTARSTVLYNRTTVTGVSTCKSRQPDNKGEHTRQRSELHIRFVGSYHSRGSKDLRFAISRPELPITGY